MNKEELKEAGEALYGSRWQTKLSRALRVDGSTVRRWAAGSVIGGLAQVAIELLLEVKRLRDIIKAKDEDANV